MQRKNLSSKTGILIGLAMGFLFSSHHSAAQLLQINDSGYFEKRGVNVFVFSNQYNGMFFDEKTAGIEIIHHGVRTSTGGAVRLQNTPEQWDLIPTVVSRKVDKKNNSIDVVLRYKEFDFNSRISVIAKDAGGIVPGILLLSPDFPENKEDWPFFWGENEVTVGGCADYILLAAAANELVQNGKL